MPNTTIQLADGRNLHVDEEIVSIIRNGLVLYKRPKLYKFTFMAYNGTWKESSYVVHLHLSTGDDTIVHTEETPFTLPNAKAAFKTYVLHHRLRTIVEKHIEDPTLKEMLLCLQRHLSREGYAMSTSYVE